MRRERPSCARGRAKPAPVPEARLPDRKPPASPESLAPETLLGSLAFTFRADEAANYLADVRESLELYSEHGLAHPGFLLRAANAILVANVELGPWIHTGSAVRHLGLVADGDRISVRGRVRDEYERKGHRFVELDVLLVERSRGPVLSVLHTAIYRPRPART
ncbi:MAG: hypothetical protein KatS3mg076_0892 [Candidatus Binatia bacterium]|nr:MAG: hypothetical protein KatS3mg076_0892 [Candidatus Binatia bacterium]